MHIKFPFRRVKNAANISISNLRRANTQFENDINRTPKKYDNERKLNKVFSPRPFSISVNIDLSACVQTDVNRYRSKFTESSAAWWRFSSSAQSSELYNDDCFIYVYFGAVQFAFWHRQNAMPYLCIFWLKKRLESHCVLDECLQRNPANDWISFWFVPLNQSLIFNVIVARSM